MQELVASANSYLRKIRRPSGRIRIALLVAGALGFVALTVVSVLNLRTDSLGDVKLPLLLAVGAAGPTLTILLNAAEFRGQARLVQLDFGWRESIETSVYGTAANLLPVPGALLVRSRVLAMKGASVKRIALASAVVPAQWLSSGFLVAGIGAIAFGRPKLGLIALGLALSAVVGAIVLARRLETGALLFGQIFAVELTLTLMSAARFYLILVALGVSVDPAQALVTTTAGILSNAAGIVPAGLGLKEALISGVGSLVDLPVSISFLAAAVDRVAGLIVLGLAFALLTGTSRRD